MRSVSIGMVQMVPREKKRADDALQTPVTLKTPQSVVHIQHNISLQQYKYWILLLIEFKEQDGKVPPDSRGFYCMSMDKLTDLLGYTPNKAEIWSDLNALKNETISFNALGKDGGKERYGAGFISEWKVSNSFIRFKFPSFLEDHMRGSDAPKSIFALMNWRIFNHFTGKHEAIIYKLCKDYVGVSRTPTMTLDQFRRYMGLKGDEYPEFMRLGQRVISEPVKRINESKISDIVVRPELQREGRKVIGLFFRVDMKKEQTFPDLPLDVEVTSTFHHAKIPIRPALQAKYLSLRTPEEIVLCIERANEYGENEENSGRTVDYGKIYRVAITDGWHQEIIARKEKSAERKAITIATQNAEIARAAEESKNESLQSKAAADARSAALDWFESLPESDKVSIEQEYLASAPGPTKALFKTRGRDAVPFRIFLLDKKPA